MHWIKTEDVQSGDIIETISRIPDHSPIFKGMMLPIVKHYGIVTNIDGKECLVHNVIGRRPTITPLEEVFTGRRIERVLRTGMCDSEILEKYNYYKSRPYNLVTFNCETLMTLIWGASIGFPQREGWSIGLLIVIAVILVWIFSNKNINK